MLDKSFTLPYPRNKKLFAKRYSLNAIYAGKHWSKRKEDSEYWHGVVKGELAKQGIRRKMFEKTVRITFSWNDNLDCSNHAYVAKMVEDALKGWLIEDDSRRYVGEILHKFHDLPYIGVTISEVKP